MQKILVPTDFSDAATNALAYAIELANQFGARISLISTYKVYTSAGMLVDVAAHIKEEVAKDMLKTVQTAESQLQGKASIDSILIEGDPAPSIAATAKRYNFDLILMGTTGASGLKEIFTGSTTNAVIANAEVPVLAIPEDCTYRPIERMVLAMDSEPIQPNAAMEVTIKVCQLHNAHISVFHQMEDFEDLGVDNSIKTVLKDVSHSIHYELDPDNINESLNEFAHDDGADWLIMIRRKRSFFENLFHRSVTKREVFDSPLPLLIVREE